MKTHLTPFQLFFLTFLYVFSGITLADADSVFALLLPFVISVFWALVGYLGATEKRKDFSDYLSAYMPKKDTGIPLLFFLFVSAAELIYVLLEAGIFFEKEASFIPFPLILAILLGIAALASFDSMTHLGRFSEMVLFLLIPFVCIRLFGGFTPMKMMGDASDIRLLFSVLPTPFFFLLSTTTVSGDEGTSNAFRITNKKPKDRAAFLVKTIIGGSAFAVLLRALILLFPFGEMELLLYFLEYSAHVAKLSLLFSILVHGLSGKKGSFAAGGVALIALATVFTLAVSAGAVFSPFLWMILLIALNVGVSGMLGIFSFFDISS